MVQACKQGVDPGCDAEKPFRVLRSPIERSLDSLWVCNDTAD